jgi:hypothetical protein
MPDTTTTPPLEIVPAESNPLMLKRNMVFASENGKPCQHAFRWTGQIPCTGVVACYLCGATKWRGNKPALF